MAKCPRAGTKFVTPSGAVMVAAPIGYVPNKARTGVRRGSATCRVLNGETIVFLADGGHHASFPLSQLTLLTALVAPPPVAYMAPRTHDRMPNLFLQSFATGVNGLGAGAPGMDVDTLRLYGTCVKKCRRHAPAALAPCIDKCQERGGQVGAALLCASQDLAGTEHFHAQNAQAWAANAIEEAELGAGDALNKGQCNRALESLVRAERKTTLASTHATQTDDARLREKAMKSNTLVNALWHEFQSKCVRKAYADRPGSVSPFGGLSSPARRRFKRGDVCWIAAEGYRGGVKSPERCRVIKMTDEPWGAYVFHESYGHNVYEPPDRLFSTPEAAAAETVRLQAEMEKKFHDEFEIWFEKHHDKLFGKKSGPTRGGLGGLVKHTDDTRLNHSFHERIAEVLGWTVQDTQGFSLQALRDLVRPVDPQLAQEISELVQRGGHITGISETKYTLPDVE